MEGSNVDKVLATSGFTSQTSFAHPANPIQAFTKL